MTVTDAPRIRTEVQVMFFDTDCGGVVHNIAYLRFIEIARTLLAEQLGLALSGMTATQKYRPPPRTAAGRQSLFRAVFARGVAASGSGRWQYRLTPPPEGAIRPGS